MILTITIRKKEKKNVNKHYVQTFLTKVTRVTKESIEVISK